MGKFTDCQADVQYR